MGLLDFTQSASNAAASNLSGPVDLIAWLLRKGGLPVPPAPVGSSAWMEEKGLTRPVQQSASSLAGETAGLLGPLAVSLKAPQIASGMLKAADNAAIPRQMSPQTGAIVWHGSPHKFDAFDSSKIGTGEGAQAYGHGLYLADSQDVAKQYAGMNPASSVRVLPNGNRYDVVATRTSGPLEELGTFATRAEAEKAASGFTGSHHYKVDLPDEHIAKMLDWDKPLSQQAPEVQKALMKADKTGVIDAKPAVDWMGRPTTERGAEGSFKYLQKTLGKGAAEARLRELGIPGIRYLDGGSRGAGSGTSNYVVFPGNESLLKILERNGVPLSGLLGP